MKDLNTSTNIQNDMGDSTRKLRIKNLSPVQKQVLLNSGIGLAGLFTGAALFSAFTSPKEVSAPGEIELDGADKESCIVGAELNPGEACEDIEIDIDINIAEQDYNHMSFDDAFAQARKDLGAGGVFEWNGKAYNTFYKEEWENMDEEGKEEFLSFLQENIEPSLLDFTKEQEEETQDLADDTEGIDESLIDITVKHDGLDAKVMYQETEEKVTIDVEAEIDKDSPYYDDFKEGFMGTQIEEVEPENQIPIDAELFDANLMSTGNSQRVELELINTNDAEAMAEAESSDLEFIIVDEGLSEDEFEIIEEDDSVISMDQYEVVEENSVEDFDEEEFDQLSDLFEDDSLTDIYPTEL